MSGSGADSGYTPGPPAIAAPTKFAKGVTTEVQATASGIWASNQSFTYTICTFGIPGVTPTLVTIKFNQVLTTQTTSNAVTIMPPLPENLRLSTSTRFMISVVDGTDFVPNGQISLENATMFIQIGGDAFSGSGIGGWGQFFISYFI